MPRNSSGVYSKPAGTTPSVGQVIDPVPWNALTTDLGNEITNSLPRDGSAPMTAPLKNADGTQALPSVTFSSDVTTGMYRKASGVGALVASGTEVATWSANGIDSIGKINDDVDLAGHNLLNVNEGVADYLTGLITTRTSGTVISVSTGSMKGNGRYVKNTAAMTKNISSNWAAGGGAGGLDTGSVAASTGYYIHAIRKISDGAFEWLYSLSLTAPTIPAGYEWVGRIWYVWTDSSSNIGTYTQINNKNTYLSAVSWFASSSSVPNALYTVPNSIPCPSGVRVDLMCEVTIRSVSGASTSGRVYDGEGNDQHSFFISNGTSFIGTARARTNKSRQIGMFYSGASGGNGDLVVFGYEDFTLPRIGDS
ncbi:hypothetical protein ACC674_15370 [Rhizobium ruizarguesonis]|jgi:hypothetical protein